MQPKTAQEDPDGAAEAADGDEGAGPGAGDTGAHVVRGDGVVAHVGVDADGDDEGEGDEEHGEEEAYAEVMTVGCIWGQDGEGEEEKATEGDGENA